MKRRFHDIEIWKKEWFMKLSPEEKCAIMYIKDDCDNVGVWDANTRLAEFIIGASIDWPALLEKTNGNIEVLENGKWWLVDFCTFQYTELSEESNSPPIKSHVALLKKHGLWERYLTLSKGLAYPIERVSGAPLSPKEKDKDKEKVKEKDKDLYNEIKTHFEEAQPQHRFTNYPKEGKAIKGLIEKARARDPDNPDVFLHGMIQTFHDLREREKFYRGQPYLPSALNSSGIWDRVLNEAHERFKGEQEAMEYDPVEVPL